MRDRIEAVVQVSSDQWLKFEDPVRVIGADRVSAVGPVLADVERLTRDDGLHAVGFLTYEAGAAFGLAVRPPIDDLPPAWFALFERAKVTRIGRPVAQAGYHLGPLAPSMSRQEFGAAYDRIKGYLATGDSYQVNFTFRMSGRFEGEAFSLFADLIEAQRGGHSAFIRIGDWAVCSASPERFFTLDGLDISARPMKGTARRGRTLGEDRRQSDALRESAKQRAENVMIVDMIRNDLGRIAQTGSVTVPELYTVERYPNVWQMTSLVTARSTASLEEIFAAMHPSASVTGAPKVRTMEILSDLEPSPRGIYTGAIGHVPPDGNASFNVAIRTAIVDERAGTVDFGIGSGIVWDSDADAEYEECLLKGSVLGRRPAPFELLETLRWRPGDGYLLLDRHLDRLRDSAEYFDMTFRAADVKASLDRAVANCGEDSKVRLLLAGDGAVRSERIPLVIDDKILKVTIAADPVDPSDVWLFHKTTNRGVYERARAAAVEYDEVILWNPSGEVTEATTANVVVDVGGERVTPPVECGLLGGTFRAELLARGDVRERVVTLDELRLAKQLWLINSVREWQEAVLS